MREETSAIWTIFAVVMTVSALGAVAAGPISMFCGLYVFVAFTMLYLAERGYTVGHLLQRFITTRRVRWKARRGDGAVAGEIWRIFDDRSFLLTTDDGLVYIHAAWSQPEGSKPLALSVGDEVSVEGPSAEEAASALGRVATFRDAPRIRVFAPEPEGAVYVVCDEPAEPAAYPGGALTE